MGRAYACSRAGGWTAKSRAQITKPHDLTVGGWITASGIKAKSGLRRTAGRRERTRSRRVGGNLEVLQDRARRVALGENREDPHRAATRVAHEDVGREHPL